MTTATETNQSSRSTSGDEPPVFPGIAFMPTVEFTLPVTLTTEMFRFAGQRLQADADHIAALYECRSIESYAEAQSKFVAQALSDYQNEAQTLLLDIQNTVSRKQG